MKKKGCRATFLVKMKFPWQPICPNYKKNHKYFLYPAFMLCIHYFKIHKNSTIDLKILKYNVFVIIFYKKISVSIATIFEKTVKTASNLFQS